MFDHFNALFSDKLMLILIFVSKLEIPYLKNLFYRFYVLADYEEYIKCQETVNKTYQVNIPFSLLK